VDFLMYRTEESRKKLLSKRIEFADLMWWRKNWYNLSTASVNWVAGGGAGTGYKW
jgi:hypothetical protein